MKRVKKEKRYFRAAGEVKNAAHAFEEFGWAYSEQQFKAVVRYRLACQFPHLRIYVDQWIINDITDRHIAERAAKKRAAESAKQKEEKEEGEGKQLRLF